MATDEPQDGNKLIDEIAKEPNLDFFFERNPVELTDDQLRELISIERGNRAAFIEKRSK